MSDLSRDKIDHEHIFFLLLFRFLLDFPAKSLLHEDMPGNSDGMTGSEWL